MPTELQSGDVTALGRLLLARPGLDAPTDDEDDDDLLLFDEEEEERDALEVAIDDFRNHPTVSAAASVVDAPDFAERLLHRLNGFNDSSSGACLLLCMGAWSADGVPGVSAALQGIIDDPQRPWPLRVLALRALVATGRPDARKVTLTACADPVPEVAGPALLIASTLPGIEARQAIRNAFARPDLRFAAIAAAAASADRAMAPLIEQASRDEDFSIRAAAAEALPRILGADARDALCALRTDPSWAVRLAAACALTAIGEGSDFAVHLEDDDADSVATLVAALGTHDRADQWPRLLAATRHARPGVRAAAAEALGVVGLSAATLHLQRLVTDTNPKVRIAALTALGRCGDRRGVHSLRRHASADGAVGAAALAALKGGMHLRRTAADGRVRVRVVRPANAPDIASVSRILTAAGLTVTPTSEGLQATGSVEPDDIPRLSALRDAIEEAATAVPGLLWSVRDGQYAIRRLSGAWILSGTRGTVARDAGWFDDPLPVPVERAPLTPLPRGLPGAGSPMAMAPLPVAVVRHVAGRKQVVAAADPERPYDPDEITGEVPLPSPASDEAEPLDDAPDPNERTGDPPGIRWDEEAGNVAEASRGHGTSPGLVRERLGRPHQRTARPGCPPPHRRAGPVRNESN